MTAMDVQMQIWRANLDLWRRAFDLQLAMTRGLIEASTAWTWLGVRVAEDAAKVEQDAAREIVGTTIAVMRDAETAAPTPSLAKGVAGKAASDAAPAESAAEAADGAEATAAVSAQSVEDVVEATADQAQEAAGKTEKPKADAPKRAPTGGTGGKSAAARRSTSKAASPPRARRKRS